MAVALGLTTVIGTLGPPIFHGTLGELAATTSGQVTFFGILVTLAGIVIVAKAGRAKERELPGDQVKTGVAEFDLRKGLAIAVFSGVMSGCFAWGLDAGAPIRALTLQAGTDPLWQGLPVLCIVLAGGLTTNLVWCVILIAKNRTAGEFIGKPGLAADADGGAPPLLRNYASGRARWHALVLPVFLLHDGREPDGTLRLLVVDAAHGVDHPVLDTVGLRAEGVAGRECAHAPARVDRHRCAGRLDRHHRRGQLPVAVVATVATVRQSIRGS
jgi:hypothetical protein